MGPGEDPMRISNYELQVSPLFEITRTDDGVALLFDYGLSGSYDSEQELWIWDGEILADLGEDADGVSQTIDRPMTMEFSAGLEDGVTERGSYEIRDYGDEGVDMRVEFDVTVYATAGTFVGEGGVSHYVFGSAEADSVAGEHAADIFFGGRGNDDLSGEGGEDKLSGGRGRDTIDGGDGADRLRGGHGADSITGGAGEDRIAGGPGRDTLEGGSGKDSFVFKGPLGDADFITDFVSGEDRILLKQETFGAIELGRLDDGVFAVIEGGVATEAGQRLIYDQGAGLLYYDADGSGEGAAVLIAELVDWTALSADDFKVI